MGMKPENQMAGEILKAHAQGPRSGDACCTSPDLQVFLQAA